MTDGVQTQRPFGIYSPVYGGVITLSDGGYLLEGHAAFAKSMGFARYTASGASRGPFAVDQPPAQLIGYGFSGVQAPDGSIWRAQLGEVPIVERFSAAGVSLGQVGAAGTDPGEFETPSDVALASDGTILIVDLESDRVQRFTQTGAYVETVVSGSGSALGELNEPSGLAVAADGSFYVLDSGNNRVQQFTAAGAAIREWGSAGAGPSQFDLVPVSKLAVLSDGTVLVADFNNSRLQRFSATGTYVDEYRVGADGAPLQYPTIVRRLSDGRVIVTDMKAGPVTVFASDMSQPERRNAPSPKVPANPYTISAGQVDAISPSFVLSGFDFESDVLPYLCSMQGCASATFVSRGSGPGQQESASGIIMASNGSVWMADPSDGEIEHYSSSGAFIAEFGEAGSGPGQFSGPMAMWADPDGSVWVLDGARRVQHLTEVGVYLGEFTLPDTSARIMAITRLNDGSFTYANYETGEVRRVDTSGTLIWSTHLEKIPLSVASLGDGRLVVASVWGPLRLLREADGTELGYVDLPDTRGDFSPSFLGVAALGTRRFLALDHANSKVHIIAYGDPNPSPGPEPVLPLAIAPSSIPAGVQTGAGVLVFNATGGTGSTTFTARWGTAPALISAAGVLDLRRLPEGRRVLRVTATDQAGRAISWTKTITIDRTPPRLRRQVRFVTSSHVTLTVSDKLSGPTQRRVTLRARRIGMNRFSIRLTDRAGNSRRYRFTIIRRPSLTQGHWNRDVLLWKPGGVFTPDTAALRAVFSSSWGPSTPYEPALIREVQLRLKQLSYFPASHRSSGVIDQATSRALARFQRDQGLEPTGQPTRTTRLALDRKLTTLTRHL